MKKIAYLLHRFPGVTDTFIKREIRSLQKAGTSIQIVSVWRPKDTETTLQNLQEWSADVEFLLPCSAFSILRKTFAVAFSSPSRFIAAVRLAMLTSRPGLRGITYQLIYFVEAILAADALRRLGIEHVHNHFGDHSGLVTMLAAKLTDIRYSISFHGPHIFLDAKYAAIKEKVRYAEFIRCISYFCRSQVIIFSESSDLDVLKIVHCGVNLEDYEYRPPRKEVKQIFCAARLAPEKGIEFLIQAIAILADKKCEFELSLAGDGSSRVALRALTVRLGLAEHVKFLGNLTEQEIERELQTSDLFVLPSLAEGIPVSVMEAMAVGVPVIATNIAGTSELVEDGKTGFLVRPSDPDALADAIVRMTENYDLRLRMSEQGRIKVTDEFDSDKETQKLNRYF
jgi:colanic acid/amylovoran biosynthesis glycosyltransferase